MTARTWEDHKTMNVPEVQGRVAFPGVPSKPRPSGYISHLLPPPSRLLEKAGRTSREALWPFPRWREGRWPGGRSRTGKGPQLAGWCCLSPRWATVVGRGRSQEESHGPTRGSAR